MRTPGFLVVLLLVGCVGSQDSVTSVHDLRVLGMQMDPPELMAPSCAVILSAATSDAGLDLAPLIASYAVPIDMTFLIEDPDGGNRDIAYDLTACTDTGDLTCSWADAGFKQLATGVTKQGELKITNLLAATQLDDAGFVLLRTFELDPYHGLGGIRVPVVLHLKTGSEEIYAQKLMVYSCAFFADQKPNIQPELPGVTMNHVDWPPDTRIMLHGPDAPFQVRPDDFTSLEESYVVPAFDLKPVDLVESWKVSYETTVGTFSASTTGGESFIGDQDVQISTWRPGNDGGITEQDVDFWFIVRDGRGGESWISRSAHYIP